MPPVPSRSSPESGIDALLLRIGSAVRAGQTGAALYEERGQRLRARKVRRAASRTARAIVREALAVTAGSSAERPPESEQLVLDLTAAPVQTVEPPAEPVAPAEPVEAVEAVEPEALEGDTVEVPVVVADTGRVPEIPRLPTFDEDRQEARAVRLPDPDPEPVAVVAAVSLPRLEAEPGAEDAEPGPAVGVDAASAEADTGLLDRISHYTRLPAAAG